MQVGICKYQINLLHHSLTQIILLGIVDRKLKLKVDIKNGRDFHLAVKMKITHWVEFRKLSTFANVSLKNTKLSKH